MNRTSTLPSPLTLHQRQALYAQTRRQATELRHAAMRDAVAGIGAALRALRRAAVRVVAPQAPRRTPEVPACPR